jgi:phospholipid-binding lipoprotein MlaA
VLSWGFAAFEAAGFFAARLARTGFFCIAVPKMKTPGRGSPGACFRHAEMRKAFDQSPQARFRGVAHLFALTGNRSPLEHLTSTVGARFQGVNCRVDCVMLCRWPVRKETFKTFAAGWGHVGGRMRRAGAIILAASILGGCATTPEALEANDPLEPLNRETYQFDKLFDQYVVLPVAWVYFFHTPQPLKRSLHNVLINLDLPVTFTNDVLQGEFLRAGSSLGRFTLNSTFGLGGLVDLATPAGLPYRSADFGETLADYGVPEGPFLVVPLIGPDPPRDLAGDAVDLWIDPLFYLPPGAPLAERFAITAGLRAGSPFEEHARNIVLRQELEKGSMDPYVTMRSVYRQLREEEITGSVTDAETLDSK